MKKSNGVTHLLNLLLHIISLVLRLVVLRLEAFEQRADGDSYRGPLANQRLQQV